MNSFADAFRAKYHGLVFPQENYDAISRYVSMHSGEKENIESRPFRRQVDFWMFSVATALALKLDPREGPVSRWGKNFIYTNQGILDNELCALLAVISVAKLGHDIPEVNEPKNILELANRLAGSGCPVVLEELSKNALRTTALDQAIQFAGFLQEKIHLNNSLPA